MTAPGHDDMVAAKILYVKMKMDYTKNPDIKSLADLKAFMGDGKGTEPWASIPGLRHKYFTYNNETDVCGGVYVFYSQKDLDAYMATDLFKGAPSWPHCAELTYEVKDVLPGTEKCIEKNKWAHSPPTREDLTAGKMLIVDVGVNYKTGIEGLPTKKEELFYAFDEGGYTTAFTDLEGLRGKWFAYDHKTDHCNGFYTFINEASLKKYMESDLFKKQAEPPHLENLTFEVQDILEGTERTMDLGSWGNSKPKAAEATKERGGCQCTVM